MENLLLIGSLLYIGALGLWLAKRLDRFFSRGTMPPYWDQKNAEAAGETFRNIQTMQAYLRKGK